MINPDHRRYFIIESGPVLEKANAYRKENFRVQKELWDFVQSVGGKAYTRTRDGARLEAIRFEGKPPYGFKAPGKDKTCKPRYNTEMAARIACLPSFPNEHEWMKDTGIGYLTHVSYVVETPEGELQGNPPIGNPETLVGLDWYSKDGPIMLAIPDQVLTCAMLRRQYPEVRFVNNEHEHDPNLEGLREILLKEWELMEEKHKRGMKLDA